MLSVRGNKILDEKGNPIRLRGVNIGGWMNMENFIDGYPGNETGIRSAMARALGPEKAEFFFDRLLDHFFSEEDVEAIKSLGATVIRIPLNYRHFESDLAPYEYLEKGFERLDTALGWCEKHGIRAILDLHAVQGWQNCGWHSDNANPHCLLWYDRGYQDRFVALWEEFARRYRGNPTVAGYDLMNEPVTLPDFPSATGSLDLDSGILDDVYRRAITAIRQIDPDHIIFPEGDMYGSRFNEMRGPFVENIVCSSHHYTDPAWGYQPYPGETDRGILDDEWVAADVRRHQGVAYASKYNLPLFVGEFGGGLSDNPDRHGWSMKAINAQLSTFEELRLHWTLWTWKGVDKMALVTPAPDSPYLNIIRPTLEAQRTLGVEIDPLSDGAAKDTVYALWALIRETIGDPDLSGKKHPGSLTTAIMNCYTASLMQPTYAKQFRDMSEDELDRLLQSFKFSNCRPRGDSMEMLSRYMALPA